MMKHKNISIVFISLLIIAILLMMSPRMLAYTIPAVENLKVEYTDGTANLSWSSVTNADDMKFLLIFQVMVMLILVQYLKIKFL